MTSIVLPEDLATVSMLSVLSEEALQELAVMATSKSYAPGEVIFKEGDPGESLHVVLKGVVKIFTYNSQGAELTLQTYTPGQSFGELAVLDPAPRSASAVALDDTDTGELGRQDLERVLDREPGASRRILGMITRQLTEAQEALKREKQVLEVRVEERTAEVRETQLEIIRRLGVAAEFRDDDTGMHISRMSQLAVVLARAAGMTRAEQELLLNAAPMHDIGKIGIPDRILLKPGKLDNDEFEIMKSHTTIGEAILSGSKSPIMKLARVIAHEHHERWDGRGYPRGISGEQISINSRICTVCDVFDALTSDRPYKKAWTIDDALAEIKKSGGSHFDPALAELFVGLKPQILATLEKWADRRDEASEAAQKAHEAEAEGKAEAEAK